MRYLVQVQPNKTEAVASSLRAIQVTPISSAFDTITIDVPPEAVDQVRVIPYVVAVSPERTYKVAQLVLPVEKKLAEFQRLFLSNPITGPFQAIRFTLAADFGKQRVPTSQSRKMVGADVADAEGISGKGIKVAVIDTGADPTCIQLPGIWGSSTVEGQGLPIDENGHSTHVATTIAGKVFQSIFGLLQGVAPDCQLQLVKVLGYGIGMGTSSSVLRGLMDAFEWGADIVSMSLGSEYVTDDPSTIPECRAVEMLTRQGIICVIANGNSGPDPNTVGVPANSPHALSIGAVDIEGKIADFSSRGPTAQGEIKPDCVAPGVNILSSTTGLIAIMQFMDGPKLGAISGTSMATPHASGTVALALQYAKSKGKTLTTEGIKEALSLYGENQPKDNDRGWGLLTYPLLKQYIDEKI